MAVRGGQNLRVGELEPELLDAGLDLLGGIADAGV
jgi:hypothetical protein